MKMSGEPERKWTAEELNSDGVSKKDLVSFLQEMSSLQFQAENKLKGTLKNVTKQKTKDQLIIDFNKLYETQSFKVEGEDAEYQKASAAAAAAKAEAALEKKTKKLEIKDDVKEEPKYKKTITKSGDKTNFPRKGDTVSCFYEGKLEDGTMFDGNFKSEKKYRKPQPLRFKVGVGNVIKGWDEALLTMSAGERCNLVIEPEWAYGKKGRPDAKIPPNATLHFDVELVGID